MNLHGFDTEEAEEILERERQRIELVHAERQRKLYTGEYAGEPPTDADGVITMRDLQ